MEKIYGVELQSYVSVVEVAWVDDLFLLMSYFVGQICAVWQVIWTFWHVITQTLANMRGGR